MDQSFVWLVRVQIQLLSWLYPSFGRLYPLFSLSWHSMSSNIDTVQYRYRYQCSRGDSSWAGPSQMHMVKAAALDLDTRLITQTGEVVHLGKPMLTKQPFLISAGKAMILSLLISHPDYCECHLLLVFDGTSWQACIETVCLRLTDEWQMSFRCHSDVIHLHYLSSLFSFSYHATCRFLNKRNSSVLNYNFSPVSSPVPCTSAFCISRYTSCELALSYEHPNLPPLPGYFLL